MEKARINKFRKFVETCVNATSGVWGGFGPLDVVYRAFLSRSIPRDLGPKKSGVWVAFSASGKAMSGATQDAHLCCVIQVLCGLAQGFAC